MQSYQPSRHSHRPHYSQNSRQNYPQDSRQNYSQNSRQNYPQDSRPHYSQNSHQNYPQASRQNYYQDYPTNSKDLGSQFIACRPKWFGNQKNKRPYSPVARHYEDGRARARPTLPLPLPPPPHPRLSGQYKKKNDSFEQKKKHWERRAYPEGPKHFHSYPPPPPVQIKPNPYLQNSNSAYLFMNNPTTYPNYGKNGQMNYTPGQMAYRQPKYPSQQQYSRNYPPRPPPKSFSSEYGPPPACTVKRNVRNRAGSFYDRSQWPPAPISPSLPPPPYGPYSSATPKVRFSPRRLSPEEIAHKIKKILRIDAVNLPQAPTNLSYPPQMNRPPYRSCLKNSNLPTSKCTPSLPARPGHKPREPTNAHIHVEQENQKNFGIKNRLKAIEIEIKHFLGIPHSERSRLAHPSNR